MTLEDEFRTYTNKQAYEAVFARRMMLREHPDSTQVLGNSQRADFLPFLHALLKQVPPEPNEALLENYRQRLAAHPQLKCGTLHPIPLEQLPLPLRSGGTEILCDAVLAIHMLYFVDDIVGTLRALYGALRPGGFLFVVVADQLDSTTGRAGRFHYARIGDESRVHKLGVEDRPIPQKGWHRAAQPQIVTVIRRGA